MNQELYTLSFIHSNISNPVEQSEHTKITRRKVNCFNKYDGPLELRAMGPHMHTLSIASNAALTKTDGTESCLMDVPYYDFNWQRVYTHSEPILMQPDDMFELSCIFDSSDQTSTTYWGDGTGEEMCLMTVFASVPR